MENSFFEFTHDITTCYTPILNDLSSNHHLTQNYDKYGYNTSIQNFNNEPYRECKEQTLNNNSDFFLITDFSSNTNGISYECYIPKTRATCELSNNISYLFEPLNNIINEMFGVNDTDDIGINQLRSTGDICTNILTHSNFDNSFQSYGDNTCIKYSINDDIVILPRNNKYLLYKVELVDNNIIKNLHINNIDYYDNSLVHMTQDFDQKFIEISGAMVTDICTRTSPITRDSNFGFTETTTAVTQLQTFYDNNLYTLYQISEDISKISLLTKYDTLYLRKLEELYHEENRKLKNLFGVDGANNGKLLDTKYMKNIKLNEIIIISLLLIFLIFIYTKKK